MRRLLLALVLLLLILAASGGAWFYSKIRASLPPIDGSLSLPGLSSPVTVERDSLGVPTITAANRVDLARALGYLHGQDRFFQMDLMRRRAAGELAEIIGKAALPLDKKSRQHRFRALARQVVALGSPEQRAVLEAYTAGVNAGLSSLRAKPFEYFVLRVEPRPWKIEDCALVAYSMVITLQDTTGDYERSLSALRDAYGAAAVRFFAPLIGPSDAALDGTTAPLPPIPGPEIINLRKEVAERASVSKALSAFDESLAASATDFPIPGSNSLAVSGARSVHGSALIASDMHLALNVPNTWYRAEMRIGGRVARPGPPFDLFLCGVTLPGTPLLVAGSNGHIAWGFTNSQVDTSDLVIVTPTESPTFYQAAGDKGLLEYEHRVETILVKGGKPVRVTYDETVFGPIIGHNSEGRPLALHWTGDDPRALNFNLLELEGAGSVKEALAIAHRLGIPPQNFLVADSSGRIGWTVAGLLPKRVGYDGRFPVSWDFGDRRWDGFLPASEVPVVADPARPYLWTANTRVLGGQALRILGDGGYERPARAAQVQKDLSQLTARARPADLLAIELDDRADFLARWHELLLETLSLPAAAKRSCAGLRGPASDWSGRADTNSVSYGLVKQFREAVVKRVLQPIFAPCAEADPHFTYRRFHYDDGVWAIVHARPNHLLDPSYRSWDDVLLAAADDVKRDGTWGKHNTLHMVHPFAHVLPGFLTSWLNMPAEELPGDTDMPRVQFPDFGESERFAVSPGRESEGIFEMPGGESGNPLSPYYRAGHEAWARDEPTPFLPGPVLHHLTLNP